jgi:type I restriction enzyme S subunit
MCDWHRGTIGELAMGHRGVAYAAGQLRQFKALDTVTLLRSNNISSGRLNFQDVQVVPSRLVSADQLLRPGDIAVCMSNGSKALVGKAAPFLGSDGERFTVGAFCSVFRPIDASAAAFVSFVFQSKEYRRNLDLALAGTAINNLRNSDLEAFGCDIPPPEEQQKIAQILDTLDTAIHETDAMIAKLKAVKQGLLHDLLTRGIDANGELRPPQAEAPHLYKQSPLGWIPKEWEAQPLAESIQLLSGQHIPSELCNAVAKGVPYFTGPSDFCGAGTVVTLYTSYPQVMCDEGDILITVKGSGCGKVAVASVRACISRQLMAIKVPRQALQYWLAVFQSRQESFNRLATGGNIPGISRTQILELTVASPAMLDEMTAIGERIRALNSKLEAEEQGLKKLRLKKSGLMDDLLTGRVRVTPLLEATAP